MTPSQARNAIKKSLKELIDPKPTKAQQDQIWQYFENQCAYCGCDLIRKERKAHLDHVVADADGGSNRLCNLILSCATCNGDEKREMDWQTFLLQKCQGKTPAYQQRHNRITQWFAEQGGSAVITNQQQAQLESAFNTVNAIYSDVVAELKKNNIKKFE